jgi:hypothetical protein
VLVRLIRLVTPSRIATSYEVYLPSRTISAFSALIQLNIIIGTDSFTSSWRRSDYRPCSRGDRTLASSREGEQIFSKLCFV